MLKIHNFKLILALGAAIVLASCGGSSNSTPIDTSVTGQFIDDVVEGLDYACSSGQESLTNDNGQYSCMKEDDVTFSLGDVLMGTLPAQSAFYTPYSIFPGDLEAALNLASLIQSLDVEANPNGMVHKQLSSGVIHINRALVNRLPAGLSFYSSTFRNDVETALGIILRTLEDAQKTLNENIEKAGGTIPDWVYDWTPTPTPTPEPSPSPEPTTTPPGPNPTPTPIPMPFVIKVKTDNGGSSGDTQFTIPTIGGDYNYSVDCDNNGTNEITGETGDYTCDYSSAGTYEIAIRGDFPQIYFNNHGDKDKLLSIEEWGSMHWRSFSYAFTGCVNMVSNAMDKPDLTNVTDMSHMFQLAKMFNQDIGDWDVSNVTHMNYMFSGANAFNQDIHLWNTSNVEDMRYMFHEAHVFNKPIGGWDTSSATDMTAMFYGACSFNQPIGGWDTSKVENMESMFNMYYCDDPRIGISTVFNQDIESWDTSEVTNMHNMFHSAVAFSNHNLFVWDVQKVTNYAGFSQGWGSGNTAPIFGP